MSIAYAVQLALVQLALLQRFVDSNMRAQAANATHMTRGNQGGIPAFS
jgi:hypothetical protein